MKFLLSGLLLLVSVLASPVSHAETSGAKVVEFVEEWVEETVRTAAFESEELNETQKALMQRLKELRIQTVKKVGSAGALHIASVCEPIEAEPSIAEACDARYLYSLVVRNGGGLLGGFANGLLLSVVAHQRTDLSTTQYTVEKVVSEETLVKLLAR